MLNARERRIFEARRLDETPVTLEELAVEFGVSRERVRQIEVRAFERVEKAVRHRVAAMDRPPALGPAPAQIQANLRVQANLQSQANLRSQANLQAQAAF